MLNLEKASLSDIKRINKKLNVIKFQTRILEYLKPQISVNENQKSSIKWRIKAAIYVGTYESISEQLEKIKKSLEKPADPIVSNSLLRALFDFCLPIEKAEDVEILLTERFMIWSRRFGDKGAIRRVKWHAFWIVLHHHSARITKAFGAIAALVGIKKLSDWVGRFF